MKAAQVASLLHSADRARRRAPAKRNIRREEQQLQQRVAIILDMVRTPAWLWWHVPNGGWRKRVEAAILKSMGVKAGVHDLHILCAGRLHTIEMKAPGGTMEPEQETFAADMSAAGGLWCVCESAADVVDALTRWQIPMRVRVKV